MRLAIMQPYFLPYIGYFQLISSVDKFVVYDNIQYTKKGWINRNRMLCNGKVEYFTLPLKKDSDYLDVFQRYISDESQKDINKIFRKFKENYKKSLYFDEIISLLELILFYHEKNLFSFIYNSLKLICDSLEINTEIIISSHLNIKDELKGQDKVIAICKYFNATNYVNSIGGIELYKKDDFKSHLISLYFLKSHQIIYNQMRSEFVPWLSIIDVLMHNGKEGTKKLIKNYNLI